MEHLEARELFSTYYVSSSGSDSSAGTSTSAPWKSIAKVNAVAFKAGDQILFAGGQTFSGNLNFDSSDVGTSAAPIKVSSYGTGKASISAGNGSGITVTNAGGFSISNLKVYGASRTTNTGYGVYFVNAKTGNAKISYVRVDGVEAYNFGQSGIAIRGKYGTSGFNDVRITNSSSHDNIMNGILIAGSGSATTGQHTNVYLGSCQTYNNTGSTSITSQNSGSGIMMMSTTGGMIERCISHDNGVNGTLLIGIWITACTNTTIQYCESYNNKSRYKDGGGFDIDGGCINCTMQYNYSHNNYGGGFGVFQFNGASPFDKVIVRYNISENDGRAHNYSGIRMWSGVAGGLKNVEIYNNTVYTSAAPSGVASALSIISGTTNVHIRNNIFVAAAGVPVVSIASGQSGFILANNDYYNISGGLAMKYNGVSYSSLSSFRSATGWERVNGKDVGFNVNPKFASAGNGGTAAAAVPLEKAVSAYKLLSSSPLINKGLSLTSYGLSPGSRDFWGDPLPQASYYEIGADEFKA